MRKYYTLAADGKTPVEADLMQWSASFENDEARRVGNTELPDGVSVSTVWLGLNHNWGDGPPLLWETMIFGGEHDGYQDRYSSYDDAVAGHEKAIRIAKGEEPAE